LVNADGSVDVWFGPKAPEARQANWVQTIPGKGWFMILRLYGPLEFLVRQDLASGRDRGGEVGFSLGPRSGPRIRVAQDQTDQNA